MAEQRTSSSTFTPTELAAWKGFLRTHAVITGQLSEAMVAEAGLSLGEYEVLLKLATSEEGCLPMASLGTQAYLTISASGLSRLVDRLRRRGLVTRETSLDGDRRSAVITITQDGRELWEAAAKTHQQRVHAMFLDLLAPDQIRGLGDVWDRLLGDSRA